MPYGTFTTATNKGQRYYQEDRLFTATMEVGVLLAVFDGHGGEALSERLAKQFPVVLVNEILDVFGYAQGSVGDAMERAFAKMSEPTKDYPQGSTATVAFIHANKPEAVIAVLGDSPALARTADGSLFIGPDHNVRSNAAEAKAATSRGGHIEGGYVWNTERTWSNDAYGLQMARAFGDSRLGEIVIKQPEIITIELGQWLLLATDGIASPGHSEVETKVGYQLIAEMLDAGKDAQALVDRALKVKTGDNVTAIVWRP